MAPRKKTAAAKASTAGKASGGRKKSKSKSNTPPPPTRPRVICPGCSTELVLHKTPAESQDFFYATMTDMKKLGIECQNEACALFIEGVEGADDNIPVNPVVQNCLADAKMERTAIKAKNKEEKAENKKRKREENAAEYAPYNPFDGAKEQEAKEGIKQAKLQIKEAKKIIKGWKKIQKSAEELEELENVVESIED